MKARANLPKKDVTFEDFDFKMVIGRGTFGKVFLGELKTTKTLYAIKSIRKDFDKLINQLTEHCECYRNQIY